MILCVGGMTNLLALLLKCIIGQHLLQELLTILQQFLIQKLTAFVNFNRLQLPL